MMYRSRGATQYHVLVSSSIPNTCHFPTVVQYGHETAPSPEAFVGFPAQASAVMGTSHRFGPTYSGGLIDPISPSMIRRGDFDLPSRDPSNESLPMSPTEWHGTRVGGQDKGRRSMSSRTQSPLKQGTGKRAAHGHVLEEEDQDDEDGQEFGSERG